MELQLLQIFYTWEYLLQNVVKYEINYFLVDMVKHDMDYDSIYIT